MPDPRSLLVSVKPSYAELILTGTKTVELRRVRPQIDAGCPVLIYASSPTMEMVGTAKVAAIDVDTIDAIWRRHAPATGITRETYDVYFDGRDLAVAIRLRDIQVLKHRVPLAELRRRINGFRPPQSFRYVAHADAAAMV